MTHASGVLRGYHPLGAAGFKRSLAFVVSNARRVADGAGSEMRWLAPAHAIGWRLAMVIVLNAFALTLPLTAVDLYVVRHISHTASHVHVHVHVHVAPAHPPTLYASSAAVPVCASSKP